MWYYRNSYDSWSAYIEKAIIWLVVTKKMNVQVIVQMFELLFSPYKSSIGVSVKMRQKTVISTREITDNWGYILGLYYSNKYCFDSVTSRGQVRLKRFTVGCDCLVIWRMFCGHCQTPIFGPDSHNFYWYKRDGANINYSSCNKCLCMNAS